MSLITCPECGGKVSDTVENCIHCGYKIGSNSTYNIMCNIDGKTYNLKKVVELVSAGKYRDSYLELANTISISIKNSLNIIEFIDIAESAPEHYEIKQFSKEEEKEAAQKILFMQDNFGKLFKSKSCPKCGSKDFIPVRKNWSLFAGFSTNKVDMVCSKCGTIIK